MSDVIEISYINAFTRRAGGGNPAAVCRLDAWGPDARLRAIATTAGPSVTAFVLPDVDGVYPLRWFTRGGREVDSFCGHATFAAAHLLSLEHQAADGFDLRSPTGQYRIGREGALLTMAAPRWRVTDAELPPELAESLEVLPQHCARSDRDWLVRYDSIETVRDLAPRFDVMKRLGDVGIIAMARADDKLAFRFFCPGFSIGENEDPATGSALSSLIPYWHPRLHWGLYSVTQPSARGGEFACWLRGDEIVVGAPSVLSHRGSVTVAPAGGQARTGGL
ncbi:PhzF family phenazine biosynthesis protein [Sphingomonas sp. BT-65]|uniref:PhzF family phenazine biosynthesis protein n=1 Tax=Sphingomonas sp. BT-65 TaxID=2989821 RepID=UPI002236A08D|nr:PhzF family phenazine biosynthesis protein [Sphingomonas sp. BT-65]MCW4460895.1 PhzF family phenazine biosynthesis protein [Sphingomonas sp. BT-65]